MDTNRGQKEVTNTYKRIYTCEHGVHIDTQCRDCAIQIAADYAEYDRIIAESDLRCDACDRLLSDIDLQSKEEYENTITHLRMQLAIKEEQLELKNQTIENLHRQASSLEVACTLLCYRLKQEVTKDSSWAARIWNKVIDFLKPDYV